MQPSKVALAVIVVSIVRCLQTAKAEDSSVKKSSKIVEDFVKIARELRDFSRDNDEKYKERTGDVQKLRLDYKNSTSISRASNVSSLLEEAKHDSFDMPQVSIDTCENNLYVSDEYYHFNGMLHSLSRSEFKVNSTFKYWKQIISKSCHDLQKVLKTFKRVDGKYKTVKDQLCDLELEFYDIMNATLNRVSKTIHDNVGIDEREEFPFVEMVWMRDQPPLQRAIRLKNELLKINDSAGNAFRSLKDYVNWAISWTTILLEQATKSNLDSLGDANSLSDAVEAAMNSVIGVGQDRNATDRVVKEMESSINNITLQCCLHLKGSKLSYNRECRDLS